VGLLLPLVLGAVSLRVGGIAFAMVTLAFAQAGSVLAFKNPYKLTGGEDGFGVDYTQLPAGFVGIFNTKNLYWLALAYAVGVFLVGRWAVNSSPGRVWQAIRENELRVEVLGLRPFDFKLMSFVLASFLATVGGIVYLCVISGASPSVTTPNFTLTLLVRVVIGGAGSLYGMLFGALFVQFIRLTWGPALLNLFSKVHHVDTHAPGSGLVVYGVVLLLVLYAAPAGAAGLARRLFARPALLRPEEDPSLSDPGLV